MLTDSSGGIPGGSAHRILVVTRDFIAHSQVAATAHLNMPKGSFTSAAVSRESWVSGDRAFYSQLCILLRVRMVLSRRYVVTTLARSSWGRFFEEFHCRGCGAHEAYRSRPRGFFERYLLPLLLLQAVRCERCSHRSYVWRLIPALERPDRKHSQSQPAGGSKSDSRVA